MRIHRCQPESALLVASLLMGWTLAQEPAPNQPESSQPSAETLPTEQAQRIVGEPGSDEEWDVWLLIEQASNLEEQATLARRFLENYPDSGLTPYAHRIIATYLYQQGEFEAFIPHAEAVVEEVPDAVDSLSELAFLYAEQKKPELAIDRAERALDQLDNVQKPLEAPARSWVSEMYRVRAESHYALGRARLSQFSEAPETERKELLEEAVEQLESALRYRPDHDFASFRLGFAERNQGDVRGTLMAYGRAAVLGGVASEPSKAAVEEILGIIQRSSPDSEWAQRSLDDVLSMAAQELEREQTRLQNQISQVVQQIEAQERAFMQQPAPQDGPATWESVDPGPGR